MGTILETFEPDGFDDLVEHLSVVYCGDTVQVEVLRPFLSQDWGVKA